MLSKMLEIQKGQIELELETEEEKKSPPPFKKEGSPLTAQLEENGLFKEFLAAFREMLSKQKEEQPVSAASPFQPPPNLSTLTSEAPSSLSIALDPSVQMTQLFHKLVETLISTDQDGIKETTLFLEGDPFSSSIFEGGKIIITEYSTAPKIFNIHFMLDQNARTVIEGKLTELTSVFQQGAFQFAVHRIDTSLLSEDEKHAIRRVERETEEEKEKHRE